MSPINKTRIAKNAAALYFRMLLTMLITLYTTRVVMNVLGETAWIENLAPEITVSPIQMIELGKQRRRVRKKTVQGSGV